MRISAIILAVMVFAFPLQAAEVRVSLKGAASDALLDDLRAASLTVSVNQDSSSTSQDLLAAARADYGRLISVLYAQAYYGPVIRIRVDGVEASTLPVAAASARIKKIVVTVTPGSRFVFSRAALKPLPKRAELPEGYAKGQPAAATVIQDAAEAGIVAWRAAGHAKADLAGQRLIADHATATLAADLAIEPGPRVRFGNLVVAGDSAVRTRRIHQIAGLPSGDIFDPDELDRVGQRLRRAGAFRSVALAEAQTVNADGSMDITASIVDERPRRIGAGAELSSQEGLELSAFWLHRNMFGGAERLRFDGAIGGIGGQSGGLDYLLGVSLSRPATFSADSTVRFSAAIERLEEPDYFEDKYSLQAGLLHQYSDSLTLGGGIELRHSEVEDDLGRRNLNMVLFPLTATWDRRDSLLNPADGFYLDAQVAPFVGMGDTASGARLYLDARAYEALGSADKLVLAGRVQMGSVLGARLADVPPEMLFFSGGGGTVRGQPYQSLGVDLSRGASVGGRFFLGLSGEARFALTDTWGVVGFADAGMIGNSSMGDDADWHSGAGLGLRYDTGIGPIRLDVAMPVSGTTNDGLQFYVGIGQAF